MPLISIGRSTSLVSESPDGGALPTKVVGIGASDGSLMQALLVESASNPNLRVSVYNGATLLDHTTVLADMLTRLNLLSDVNPVDQSTVLANILTALATVQSRQSRQYEFNGTSWDLTQHSFNQSAAGVNSNGAGSTLSLATTPISKFTIIVLLTIGSAAFVVDLEGQINGIGWVPLGTLSSSSAIDALHVVNKAVNAIRYNVTTIGGGNTMTIGLLASAR